MRMVADYAARYGGPPAMESPWHLFVGLVRQCARFDAKDFLRAMDGPLMAQAGGEANRIILYRQHLVKVAGLE